MTGKELKELLERMPDDHLELPIAFDKIVRDDFYEVKYSVIVSSAEVHRRSFGSGDINVLVLE